MKAIKDDLGLRTRNVRCRLANALRMAASSEARC
jgi:hypothetical protein